MTYPHLVNTLGLETYGFVIIGQAFADIIMITTNFGFEISGTKSISSIRDSIQDRNKLITDIYIIKVFSFLIVVVPVFILANWSVPYQHQGFVIAFILSGFVSGLIPFYFFQGMERMSVIFFIKLVSGLTYLFLVLWIIRSDADFVKVSYIKLSVELLGLILSIVILKYIFNYRVVGSSRQGLTTNFNQSSVFFISKIGNIASSKAPLFFVNFAFGAVATTLLDFIIKIYSICQIPIDVLAGVVFPASAKSYNKVFIKKMIYINLCAALVIYIMANLSLPYMLELFFKDINYAEIRTIFFIYGGVLLFNAVSGLMGTSVLVSNGYSTHYNLSVFLAFSMLCSGLFLSYVQQNVYMTYYTLVIASSSLAVYRVFIGFRKKLL